MQPAPLTSARPARANEPDLNMNRRHFIQTGTAAALSSLVRGAPEPSAKPVSFFLVGDTHYCADEDAPDRMNPNSSAVTARLVDWLNKLPGTSFPNEAGGGPIDEPQGVIHAGDLIDSGDKSGAKHEAMQRTEWAAFTADWGLDGGDGRLRWPVREVHGNHDSPHGKGLVIDGIIARNKKRGQLANVSSNGLHYSWDWHGVHFINLGIVVGEVRSVSRKRRYAPMDSLDFLVGDLAEKVGRSGRPVVITHHVDMMRYAAVTTDEKVRHWEWDYADVRAYHEAIKDYKVAAILYGHTHARNIFRWNGGDKPVTGDAPGIPVFNTDNASHFKGTQQAFLHFTITGRDVIAREFATTDAWLTGAWNPQVWKFSVPA